MDVLMTRIRKPSEIDNCDDASTISAGEVKRMIRDASDRAADRAVEKTFAIGVE